MKKLLIFLGALVLQAQQVTISDTLPNAIGGDSWTGRIIVTLNSPGRASYGAVALSGWQYTLCVGTTGADCSATTAAGVVTIPIYATTTLTPSGLSYTARYMPTKGSPRTETWTIEPSDTTLAGIISSTVPTPTTTFQASQIVPGSNGQVLTTTAGASAWGSVPACATCVVTSGSYADPAWITSLAGSKVSGNIAGNAATATALQTARTIAGVSFNGTANISIPSTGLSDTANLVRNNAANTYTAGSKQTFAHSATTAGLNVGVQATAPSSPAQGDVFFNSTLTRKGVYDGTQWRYELYAPSSGTGVVSWDGTSLSASTTLAGLASVTSTSFTGSLTGNASTATALSSTVASGRLWIGQGTGAPTSDSVICADTTNHWLGVGTCSPAAVITAFHASANDHFRFGFDSNYRWTFGRVISSGSFTIHEKNLGSSTDAERARFHATTGNFSIGTTTDLGYGLAAQKTGSTGTLLAKDPTSVTGFTRVLFDLGAADTASTEIFRINGTMRFGGTNTTGAGSAALGSNSPATTNTAPYTWIRAVAADGSTVYIPAWK